jgi:hypothetical protein
MEILSASIERLPPPLVGDPLRQASGGHVYGIFLSLLTVAVAIGSSGCRRASGLDVHPVSGTVTVDGAPLAEGFITFRALEGDTRGFGGRITDGGYRVEAFAGRARIEVTAARDVPGEFVSGGPGTEPQPKREQFIPRRYNEKTELEADIPPGGRHGLDFDLTTKKP